METNPQGYPHVEGDKDWFVLKVYSFPASLALTRRINQAA
jgi:hypothetical protein